MPAGRPNSSTSDHFAVSHKKLSDLRPDNRNANKGTERGNAIIERSLRDYGAGRSILLDKHGAIIAGNKTVENCGAIGLDDVLIVQSDGTKLVAVQRTDLDLADPRTRQLAIADNRAGQVSLDWDTETLKDLALDGVDLAPFWSADELEAMWPQKADLLTDEDEVPPVPVEPKSKLGDLYLLGNHRLLCGDSTKREDVDRLMAGQKADMVFTDPPYGVDYKGIKNDDRCGLGELLRGAFGNFFAVSKSGASIYVFHSDRCADIFHTAFREFFHFSSMIIWAKNSLTLSQTDYQSQHEPCFYGWMDNGTHSWHSDRKQTSVWRFDKERVEGHTTPKPVELVARALSNSSKGGDIVLDLFGGSGSTLIACEKTGRNCFMMELSPAYCDVIVTRWENATGKKAVLDGSTA